MRYPSRPRNVRGLLVFVRLGWRYRLTVNVSVLALDLPAELRAVMVAV
jgi:hypothetical protein